MANEQSEFWSAVATRYDRVVDQQIGPKARSMVRERSAREGPLGRVAEFGCGTGFYTPVLASKAHSVVATDISAGMLEIAKRRAAADNVTFQMADCQQAPFPDGAFDTAFISLVIHFTEPARTLAEMHRILKPGGTLIIANLDPQALSGLNRWRSMIRIVYRGLTGYRMKPPKGFGRNVLSETRLRDLLRGSGFEVASSETMRDPSRSSHIPVVYIRAVRL